jgi:hypothetical protein
MADASLEFRPVADLSRKYHRPLKGGQSCRSSRWPGAVASQALMGEAHRELQIAKSESSERMQQGEPLFVFILRRSTVVDPVFRSTPAAVVKPRAPGFVVPPMKYRRTPPLSR